MSIIDYKVEDGVAILTWNEPGRAVNVLNGPALAELDEAVKKAAVDEAVKGIVLTSGKPGVFVAGGDLEQIKAIGDGPMNVEELLAKQTAILDQFRRMETCGKPVVAALNGVTLGGGLELALACHRRVLADSRFAKVGLPEAGLGLMPGCGGTQRLPRLIGLQGAIGLILEGKQLEPADALKARVVEEVVPAEEVVAAAKRWILSGGSPVQAWDDPKYQVPGGGVDSPKGAQLFMGTNAMVHANTYGNFPHSKAILSAIYEGMKLPMDRAGKVEVRYFLSLLQGHVARSMLRTLFFGLEAAQKGERRPKDFPRFDVKKVGVLGAGLMGQGIANVSAKAGIEVVLLDRDLAAAQRGKDIIAKGLEKLVTKGKTTREKADALLGRIHPSESYDDLRGADVVVEAVFEDRDIKAKVNEAAEARLGPDAIVASNTSGLPITDLANAVSRPENFIGLHFFSPVERMQMVEIVVGEKTSQATLAKAWDYLLKIKKAGIVVNDSPGFYTSRVFGTFIAEGTTLLVEGVPPALIENAAKLAGMPMPPLGISDQVGLGTMHKVAMQAKKDAEAAGKEWKPPPGQPVVARLVELGREGANTASRAGFYEYLEGGKKRLWPGLGEAISGLVATAKDVPPADEVVRRYLFTQCLEAARCIEQGVITSVTDADVGVVMAVGFPAFTGGPCSYMDSYGIAAFVAEADRLAAKYGSRFEPPKLLRDMAASGRTFHG